MGGWNQWMNERDQAPLDRFSVLFQKTWEETKEWLHDLCIEEGKTTSNVRNRKSDSDSHAVSVEQQAGGEPVLCATGYEELDQRASEPPSALPSQENITAGPPMHSTDPLPGVSNQTTPCEDGPGSNHRKSSGSIGEQKLIAAAKSEEKGAGPSLHQDERPMWQRGGKLEVWSISKQSWFEGVVVESFAEDGVVIDGRKIPMGSYKVLYSENIMKWIWPDQAQQILRSAQTIGGI